MVGKGRSAIDSALVRTVAQDPAADIRGPAELGLASCQGRTNTSLHLLRCSTYMQPIRDEDVSHGPLLADRTRSVRLERGSIALL